MQRMRLSAALGLVASGVAGATDALVVGDGQIDGTRIAPYELTWRQCSLADGNWVAAGDLTEKLVTIGETVFKHQQMTVGADGSTTEATTYFDRRSFAPLRLEYVQRGPDGSVAARAEHVLTADGYTGRVTRGDQSKEVTGAASSAMMHGGSMGLSLATLDSRVDPLRFSAAMINFDATYKVTATWAGTETLDYQGAKVVAMLVDVEWLHEGLGDIYPAGPDESGGRYWIVADPPEGFPYVPRYKTDTYAVEFLPVTCPDAMTQ